MRKQRIIICFVIGLFLLVLLIFIAINSGSVKVSVLDLVSALRGSDGSSKIIIMLNIRMPRVILAILCGGGMSLAGCILQNMTQNELADPGILGINAGAGVGVLIFLAFFPGLHVQTMVFMPIFAIIGGIATAVFLFRFSYRENGISPSYLLIGGIGAAAGFTAVLTIIGTNMEGSMYQTVARWLAGSIGGTSWHHVFVLLPYLIVLLPIAFSQRHMMDVLVMGSDTATGIGVNVSRSRALLLFVAVGVTASGVSVSGGLSFVGLAAPHIARRLVGGSHSRLMPFSYLAGAILLLAADTAGRTLFRPLEIPVGIVISVICAPYFLYLLHKKA